MLYLLSRIWLESPVRMNESYQLPLEQVLKQRQAATIEFQGSKGSSVQWFYTKVSSDKYAEGIGINRAVIFNVSLSETMLRSKLDALIGERLLLLINVVQKHSIPTLLLTKGDYPSQKKDYSTVLTAMQAEMLLSEDYPEMLGYDFIEQHKIAKGLKDELEANATEVMQRLDLLRKRLIAPKNTFVHLSAELDLLVKRPYDILIQ